MPALTISALPVSEIALENPKQLATYLKQNQYERWQTFHCNDPRILVIDDNKRTIDHLQYGLQDLYGEEIESCNDPLEALERIKMRKASGQSYDLIVLDLHMPQMTGMRLMKELGADCPAVVVNTASMMSPALSDLCIQMDNYRSTNIANLIHTHVMERRPQDLPLAPIFINLKDSNWKTLVDKIDSALFVKDNIPNFAAAISSFLEVYKPKLVPITYTAVSVHSVVEEVRNAINSIDPLIQQLKKEHGLTETEWWRSHQESLETAIKDLRNLKFTDLDLENPQAAFNHIHNIAGTFNELSCRGLEFNDDQIARSLVHCWREEYQNYNQLISEFASGLRSYASDGIDLPAVLQVMASNLGLSLYAHKNQGVGESTQSIKDNNKDLRNFLEGLLKGYRDQFLNLSTDKKDLILSDLTIEYVCEGLRWNEDQKTRKALEKIGAGDYYAIHFQCSPAQFDQIVIKSNISGNISELFKQRKICWKQGSEDDSNYTLFIKASPNEVSFPEYVAKIESEASKVSFVIPELGFEKDVKVYKHCGKAQNITCLGELPGTIDYATTTGKASQVPGIIYEYQGQCLFAPGKMHKDAAQLIADYIRFQTLQGDRDFCEATFLPDRNDIYANGVRITIGLSDIIQVEKLSDLRKSERAKNILLDLGILKQRAAISDLFAPKAILNKFEEARMPEGRAFTWQKEFEDTMLVDIQNSLKAKAETAMATSTTKSYIDLINGPRIEEPVIVIRTLTALDVAQQRELLLSLFNVMKAIRLSPRNFIDRKDQVIIDGSCGRKSGLYLFNPNLNEDELGINSYNIARKLIPLINGSTPNSLNNEGIIICKGELLPKDSLVFGAGDHSLRQSTQQLAMGLSVELLLQSLKIPYEICRGNLSDDSAFHAFDGNDFSKAATENFMAYKC